MTNTDIITAYKTAHRIPEDTPLYTAAVWYNKGYKIKPRTACKHRVEMKVVNKGRCYAKMYYLFDNEQVERRQQIDQIYLEYVKNGKWNNAIFIHGVNTMISPLIFILIF